MSQTQTEWTADLTALDACHEAVTWARAYDSLDAAWAACERADWMLWLLGRVAGPPKSEGRKTLVLCACACARTSLRFVLAGESRPLACIETAERWARGEASIEEARAARRAAATAATAAAAAAYAAYAAATAATAATAAAAAAAYAAAAAAAYAATAAATAATTVRHAALRELAEIVRTHYPTAPALGGIK